MLRILQAQTMLLFVRSNLPHRWRGRVPRPDLHILWPRCGVSASATWLHIDIPGPWLHPIARHESEDGNYTWFHWNQWRNTFHDDSWIHCLEMFGCTLVATWFDLKIWIPIFVFISEVFNFDQWGIFPDLLHILDLTIYPDLYASSYMLWTDTSNIFSGRGRDDRLQKIYLRYVQWCAENRPLPLTYKYVSHCLVLFV